MTLPLDSMENHNSKKKKRGHEMGIIEWIIHKEENIFLFSWESSEKLSFE